MLDEDELFDEEDSFDVLLLLLELLLEELEDVELLFPLPEEEEALDEGLLVLEEDVEELEEELEDEDGFEVLVDGLEELDEEEDDGFDVLLDEDVFVLLFVEEVVLELLDGAGVAGVGSGCGSSAGGSS